MKPTAPLRSKLTLSLPLIRPLACPSMSHRFPRAPFSVFSFTRVTSSRFPASLVRLKLVRCPRSLAPTLVVLPSMSLHPALHSPGSHTPPVLFFNDNRGLGFFLPAKTPFGLPVHVAPLPAGSILFLVRR